MVSKSAGKSLEFIFDFGSPNAYLAMKILPDLLDRTGADLIITPCLLGGIFKLTASSPLDESCHAGCSLPRQLGVGET